MAILIAVIAVFVVAILMRTSQKNPQYPVSNATILDSASELSYADHVRLGNEAAGQYDFDKSLAHFQEALKLKSDEPALHFKIGRLFIQKADYKNALVAFRNVLSLNPNQTEAHFAQQEPLCLMDRKEYPRECEARLHHLIDSMYEVTQCLQFFLQDCGARHQCQIVQISFLLHPGPSWE